jgi:hypothetical protein
MAAYNRSLLLQSSYSVGLAPELIERLEHGNKILLPPEVLAEVINLEYQGQMIFRLTDEASQKQIYVGVLEFNAPKDTIVLPFHLMQDLEATEEDIVIVELVTLPKARSITFKANTYGFYNLANPKAILENELRYYVSLTTGQNIPISHVGTNYVLTVTKSEPGPAVDILDTDVSVDFEPADDTPVRPPPPSTYQPPQIPQRESSNYFPGTGLRVGEKYYPGAFGAPRQTRGMSSPSRGMMPPSRRMVLPSRDMVPPSRDMVPPSPTVEKEYFTGTARVLGGRPGVTRRQWSMKPQIPAQPPILGRQVPISVPSPSLSKIPMLSAHRPMSTVTIPVPSPRPVSTIPIAVPSPSMNDVVFSVPPQRPVVTTTPRAPVVQPRTQAQIPSDYLYKPML